MKKKVNGPPKGVIAMYGPETRFLTEILNVIDRHAHELTVFQLLGGLVSAARELLNGETEDF